MMPFCIGERRPGARRRRRRRPEGLAINTKDKAAVYWMCSHLEKGSLTAPCSRRRCVVAAGGRNSNTRLPVRASAPDGVTTTVTMTVSSLQSPTGLVERLNTK
ncbi:hypothetical protein EVAR_76364_1 [Eumeta japonica]|uniref:Uncharacterized protein n=1 Tax=Eumeta variegata TaxID=151549 RepID=A0A4C1T7N5_EUMVA|nr:hypothetical protein EVAR_76364_1 [Eumeta japonica]